ncbi:MAG: ScaI family restriction endonuclease [Alphaproteobacteria bacterium]
MPSPYDSSSPAEWSMVTHKLLDEHPVRPRHLLAAVEATIARYPLGTLQEDLGHLEFALDHGMSRSALPHKYRGLERGGVTFLARILGKELARSKPEAWRIEETDWGSVARYVANNHYSISILTSEVCNDLDGISYGRRETHNIDYGQPSGYVAILQLDLGETPGFDLRWGWIDRKDWCVRGSLCVVPTRTVEAKTVHLRIS